MVLRAVAVDGYGVVHVSTSRANVTFASVVPDALVCRVCSDALRQPLRAPCGHAACATCAEASTRRSGACGACGRLVREEDWIEDQTLALDVGNLRTHCPYAFGRGASGTVEQDEWGD